MRLAFRRRVVDPDEWVLHVSVGELRLVGDALAEYGSRHALELSGRIKERMFEEREKAVSHRGGATRSQVERGLEPAMGR